MGRPAVFLLFFSCINQLIVCNLRCPISDAVHLPDPFHLVTGFQRFRNALCICNLFYQPKKQLLCLPVNICKLTIQLAAGQQIGVKHPPVLLEISEMSLTPYPD